MGFQGVLRALYSYAATNAQELSLEPNDLVYLLEKADDGWWTVKKRVPNASSDEPQGLVPHNYVAPAHPESTAHALFDYTAQTEDEASFKQGDVFDVYAPDGDWVLVGVRGAGAYGFVPFNYLQYEDATPAQPQRPAASAAAAAAVPTPASPAAPAVASPPAQSPLPALRSPAQLGSPALPRDDEAPPPKPARPGRRSRSASESGSRRESDSRRESGSRRESDSGPKEARFEVQDVNGKRKTSKTLLLSSQYLVLDGTVAQKWAVEDIMKYNQEKKHVFLELRAPRMSLDLKAGSQGAAEQIVATIGQMVGAKRGGGLEEVIALANVRKLPTARVLLDFKGVNGREVTVFEGEDVQVVNDRDKDWWLVRTSRGQQGLVPRKFVSTDPADRVQRKPSARRSRPASGKTRTWVDRSGSYRVDAQFLGFADGKVQLHKENGVKIAVPAAKLSFADLDFVEHETGADLSEYRALAGSTASTPRSRSRSNSAASTPRMSDRAVELCDWWLSFFLECNVDPQNANRYAKNFARDNMDESMLAEVTAPMLRTFGLREGDILRVMRRVNEKTGRAPAQEAQAPAPSAAAADEQVWGKAAAAAAAAAAAPPAEAAQAKAPLVAHTTQTPLGVQPTSQPAAQPAPQPAPQPIAPALTGALTGVVARPAAAPQPTGALADLMGITPQAQQALVAQKTAEAELAAQQRRTQQQILMQQAELQREQIRLLKEQQEQLRRQQKELIEIQKTGSKLQSLGPFATGVAGLQQFATGVQQPFAPAMQPVQPFITGVQPLATAPQPPASRPLVQLGALNLNAGAGVRPTTTGPFTQPGAFVQQPATTGPFTQQPTTTGPFVPQQQPATTGPFQPSLTGTLVQPSTTGPFGLQPQQPATTGPFGVQQQPQAPLGLFGQQPQQPSTTGPFGVQPQQPSTTGPFGVQPQQPSTTGPFGLQQQPQQPTTTGPFGVQQQPPTAAAPFQPQAAQASVFQQRTGPFQPAAVTGQRTGPFQPAAPAPTAFSGLQGGFQPSGLQSGLAQTQPQNTFQQSTFQQNAFQPQLAATRTGPFQTPGANPTGSAFQPPLTGVPTGPFQAPLAQATQPQFNALANMRTGPFQGAGVPAQTGQPTGPFSNGAGAFPAGQLPGQYPGAGAQFSAPVNAYQTGPSAAAPFGGQQPFGANTAGVPPQQPPLSQPASMPNIFGQLAQLGQQAPPGQPGQVQPGQAQAQSQPFSFGAQQPFAQPQPAAAPQLQSQATGFGFGNQEQPRANVNLASASNPFGL